MCVCFVCQWLGLVCHVCVVRCVTSASGLVVDVDGGLAAHQWLARDGDDRCGYRPMFVPRLVLSRLHSPLCCDSKILFVLPQALCRWPQWPLGARGTVRARRLRRHAARGIHSAHSAEFGGRRLAVPALCVPPPEGMARRFDSPEGRPRACGVRRAREDLARSVIGSSDLLLPLCSFARVQFTASAAHTCAHRCACMRRTCADACAYRPFSASHAGTEQHVPWPLRTAVMLGHAGGQSQPSPGRCRERAAGSARRRTVVSSCRAVSAGRRRSTR